MQETAEDKMQKLKDKSVDQLMDDVFEIRNTGLQCLRLEQDFENHILDLSQKHNETMSSLSVWDKIINHAVIKENKRLVGEMLQNRDTTRVSRFLNVIDILAQASILSCAIQIYKKDEITVHQKQKLQDIVEFAIKLIERITLEKIPVPLREQDSAISLINYFSNPNFKFDPEVLDKDKYDYL